MKPVVIYHKNCLDGFGAACVAYDYFQRQQQEVEFIAANHHDLPPNCQQRDVYIFDYSYKRTLLAALCLSADNVTLIDHHISAEQDLAGLDEDHGNLQIIYDTRYSAAVLVWQFFNNAKEAPPCLLQYIQDNDLWEFKFKETQDIVAALRSYPFDFVRWQHLIYCPDDLCQLLEEGQAINRYRRQQIEYYKEQVVLTDVAGYHVPVVNCPPSLTSELLNELALGHPFAMGYQDIATRRNWSLRSTEEGIDVARVAQRYGGGGHRHAAGFSTHLPHVMLSPQLFIDSI